MEQQQIVSEEWVRESTSRKVKIPTDVHYAAGLDYGYWWWIQDKGYMAWGAGGQYIIVRPDLDLVVVSLLMDLTISIVMASFLDRF